MGGVVHFPKALEYLKEGRTCVSHLALLVGKMTQANEEIIWTHILDKGRREVEEFLRRVQCDGTVKAQGDTLITLTLTVTTEQEAMIHRLTEVLSARGQVPTTVEAIMAAVDKLLDQKDQLRRAEKMAEKDKREASVTSSSNRQTSPVDDHASSSEPSPVARQSQVGPNVLVRDSEKGGTKHPMRRPLPAAVRRDVYRKAQGMCQHVMPDGQRCGAMRMVEIEHIKPIGRGGGDEVGNLTLVCREHNQYRARLIMGYETMDRYRREQVPASFGHLR